MSFFYRIYRKTRRDLEGSHQKITLSSYGERKVRNHWLGQGNIHRPSVVLNTELEVVTLTLSRFSQLIWSSMQVVSEPPNLLNESDDMSAY